MEVNVGVEGFDSLAASVVATEISMMDEGTMALQLIPSNDGEGYCF